jgi:hypothetical protein
MPAVYLIEALTHSKKGKEMWERARIPVFHPGQN